jgi:nickel/cobalt transporter (NiCoT) family protein
VGGECLLAINENRTVVGLFVLTWAAALLIWRLGRAEEKWTAHLAVAAETD